MTRFLLLLALATALLSSCRNDGRLNIKEWKSYRNPVSTNILPDPTVIESDGTFYLYATEGTSTKGVPIMKSEDLVTWEEAGYVFTDETRPAWFISSTSGLPGGSVWAPDVNFIDGRFVMYYSLAIWGQPNPGIGIAVSDSPTGPWKDLGKLFDSDMIGVRNSIDPCYVEEDGQKYLFWGSFNGVYGIELSDDGMSVKDGAEKKQVAGTIYEGTYIHKHDGYWYLFGSMGSCCNGLISTYTTVVGRAESIWGPYLDKQGQPMLENHHEIVLTGDDRFAGTGHNAEFVTDDDGNDWILYHAYCSFTETVNRNLCIDRIYWIDGWPQTRTKHPSVLAEAPALNKK